MHTSEVLEWLIDGLCSLTRANKLTDENIRKVVLAYRELLVCGIGKPTLTGATGNGMNLTVSWQGPGTKFQVSLTGAEVQTKGDDHPTSYILGVAYALIEYCEYIKITYPGLKQGQTLDED